MFDFLKKKSADKAESFDDFPDSPYPKDNAGMPPLGNNDPFGGPSNNSSMPPLNNDPGMPPMSNSNPFPDMSQPSSPNNSFAPDPYAPKPITPPGPAPVEQSVHTNGDKMEVVLAKLDTLKSMMEMLNQRIATLEHQIKEDKKRW